jgi:hypothetical protein
MNGAIYPMESVYIYLDYGWGLLAWDNSDDCNGWQFNGNNYGFEVNEGCLPNNYGYSSFQSVSAFKI